MRAAERAAAAVTTAAYVVLAVAVLAVVQAVTPQLVFLTVLTPVVTVAAWMTIHYVCKELR